MGLGEINYQAKNKKIGPVISSGAFCAHPTGEGKG